MKKIMLGIMLLAAVGAVWFRTSLYEHSLRILKPHSKPHAPIHPRAILVVNINHVRNESAPFKQLSGVIEKRYGDSNQQILSLETELRDEYKRLRNDEKLAKMNPDDLLKQREDFDRRISEIEEMVMRKKSDLNDVFIQEKQKIEALLNTIIDECAQKYKADLVLNTSLGEEAPLVLFATASFDITQEVMDQLNARATQLDLVKD